MTNPDGTRLYIEHDPGSDRTALARRYLDALAFLHAGELILWHADGRIEGDEPDGLFRYLDTDPESRGGFTLTTADGASITVSRGHGSWDATSFLDEAAPDRTVWLTRGLRVLEAVLDGADVRVATLSRRPNWAFTGVPAPPLLRWNHGVAIPESLAARVYGPAEQRFWASWDSVQTRGGLRLASRALTAVTDEQWLRAVLPDQLALARLARPGETTWPRHAEDWDAHLLRRDGVRLEPVGYLPGEAAYELAGVFGPDEHVPLADILTIRAMVEAGRTSQGHPLNEIRVVFSDEATARREATPLLDAGAIVEFVDADGERAMLQG